MLKSQSSLSCFLLEDLKKMRMHEIHGIQKIRVFNLKIKRMFNF